MKTLRAQIDGVNLAANNLVESGHPRSGEVKQYQDRLNKRWGLGRVWAGWGGMGGVLLAPDSHLGKWPEL